MQGESKGGRVSKAFGFEMAHGDTTKRKTALSVESHYLNRELKNSNIWSQGYIQQNVPVCGTTTLKQIKTATAAARKLLFALFNLIERIYISFSELRTKETSKNRINTWGELRASTLHKVLCIFTLLPCTPWTDLCSPMQEDETA